MDTTTKPLTPRRLEFARQYVATLNGALSARRAGYAAKSSDSEASRLLGIVEVQREIARIRADVAASLDITPEFVAQELAALAFSNMGDYFTINAAGLPVLDLAGVEPGKLSAIASVKHDATGTTIKLHDKHAALVTLARTLGMVQDGSTNVLIQTHDAAKLAVLTTEELRKSLDSGVFEADSTAESPDFPALETGHGLPENRTGAEPRHEAERLPSLSGEIVESDPPQR